MQGAGAADVEQRAVGGVVQAADVGDHDRRRLKPLEPVDRAVARPAGAQVDGVEVAGDAGRRPVAVGDRAGGQLGLLHQRRQAVAPRLLGELRRGAAFVAVRAEHGDARTGEALVAESLEALDEQLELLRLVRPVPDLGLDLVVGPAHARVAGQHVAAGAGQAGDARRVAAVDAQLVAEGAGARGEARNSSSAHDAGDLRRPSAARRRRCAAN